MTEKEWMKPGADPELLIRLVHRKLGRNERRARLYSCALVRRFVWELLTSKLTRVALEASEKFADGDLKEKSLKTTNDAVESFMMNDDDERDSVSDEELQAVRLAWIVSDPKKLDVVLVLGSTHHIATEICKQRATLVSRVMSDMLRDIFGNPFRPVALDPRWLTSTVVDLARAIYDERAFDRMPILTDALMDAGCDSDDIIAHCRSDGPHTRGCWVVDLLLNKT